MLKNHEININNARKIQIDRYGMCYSPSHLRHLCNSKKLPARKLLGQWVIKMGDLEEYMGIALEGE